MIQKHNQELFYPILSIYNLENDQFLKLELH
jgi:hypothetical protein